MQLGRIREDELDEIRQNPEIIDTSLYRNTSLDLGQLWQFEGWYFSVNPTYDRSPSLFGGGANANAMANWVIKKVK